MRLIRLMIYYKREMETTDKKRITKYVYTYTHKNTNKYCMRVVST